MAITTLNNRAINRSDTAAANQLWTATSATATDFQAVSAGKIGQVVSTTKTDITSTTSTSLADITGMSVAITPAATSSKILVLVDVKMANETAGYGSHVSLLRDSTEIYRGDAASNRSRDSWGFFNNNNDRELSQGGLHYLDSPSSTSEVTYKLQWKTESSGTVFLNHGHDDAQGQDNSYNNRMASSITVMEVLA